MKAGRPSPSGPARPALVSRRGDELPLSGEALLDLARTVLGRGKTFRFRARGWSMLPFIHDGDVITIIPLGSSGPRIGDIVAFVSTAASQLVVHRVVARQAGRYLIQGDNTAGVADGPIVRESILGRITRVERGGRAVYLGLGPERKAIACLSRYGLLSPVLQMLSRVIRLISRRRVV